MQIIIAKNIGFCFGVERAYQISLDTLKKKNGDCQMLGNLVHNENVIADLKKKGLKFISSPDEAQKGLVIIRAHGVGDATIKELELKKVEIVDATCPLVKKAQDFARKLAKEGREVIIIGENNHAEVKAINGSIDNRGIIIESDKEIDKIPKDKRIGVVVQTTQNARKINKIIKRLKEIIIDIEFCDTLCDAVGKRQEEVREIASQRDIVLVVGSKNSANTQRLFEISKEINEKTFSVENKDSLDASIFFDGAEVGIISGTSAPIWIIEEIVDELKKIKENL